MVLHLILILCLLPAGAAQGKRPDKTPSRRESLLAAKTYQSPGGQTLPYRLFVPRAYDQQKKYPLMLYLHGGGGLGRDNLKQIQGGSSFMISLLVSQANQAKYPCFVLVPQAHD